MKHIDVAFKKSTFSPIAGGVWCVEVKRSQSDVQVRDSKTGDVQVYNHNEWNAFIEGVKSGEFDL